MSFHTTYMDSANNSGSLHSSSGAEEECDSRAAALQDSHLITTLHQPPPPFNHHHNDQITNTTNPLLFQLPHLPSNFSHHHLLPSSSLPPPPLPSSPLTTTAAAAPLPPTRNPKKRSRASRRAPTTVLTTNTDNFRAMVQEFTGIPPPPFTSSFDDIFGRSSTMMMRSCNTNNFDHNLSNLLPQKLPSFFDTSCNLLNTMQNPIIKFPYNISLNQTQTPLLNPNITQTLNSTNGFDSMEQTTQVHDHHTSLPDIISAAATPTTTTSRIDEEHVASGTEIWYER